MLSKIAAKNFLSWKELEFKVSNGVTLIDGFNHDDETSEGSGKSAVLNALSWCLYGKIPKEAKIDDVIKDGEKSCTVQVELSSGHIICRSRKPNELVIREFEGSGFLDIKGKDAKETQKLIEELVGLTFETFCQTVYFAQNYDKKFITSNQEDKAKILSEVQDLQIFDKARKEAMTRLKLEQEGLQHVQVTIELQNKDIALVETNIKNNLALKAQLQGFKDQQLKQLMDRLIEVKTKLQTTEDAKTKYEAELAKSESQSLDSIQEAITAAEIEGRDLQTKIANIESIRKDMQTKKERGKKYALRHKKLEEDVATLKDWLKNPTNTCPTCQTELGQADTSHAEAEVLEAEKEKAELLALLSDLSKELQNEIPSDVELQTSLYNVSQKLIQLKQEQNAILTHNKSIEEMQRELNRADAVIAQLKSEGEKLAQEYKVTQEAPIDDKASELKELNERLEMLNSGVAAARVDLKEKQTKIGMLEELKQGFKEVKSHVFNSMLNEINGRVNQYLERLFEIPVTIQFNNQNMKIQTDITMDGVSRGLGLLSGGQFRRVSLATDLALSDVISARKNAKLGVLILDEPFQNMSETSMVKSIELLEQKQQPIIIIEHNSMAKAIVNQTFFVKLQNGTSYEQV